ncbi:MAG: hypothetical protein WCD20_06895 [Rhodomicrobium sp.]
MINSEELDELFRCLLAGVGAPKDDRQVRFEQSQQLVQAFDRISDSGIRQELILLIEIVSKMPEALHQQGSRRLGRTMLSRLH